MYGGAASGVKKVPCSKGEIFASSTISLIEKRQLMKFLQTCAAMQPTLEPHIQAPPQALAAPDAPAAPPPQLCGSFCDFMATQRLSAPLQALALGRREASTIHWPRIRVRAECKLEP